MKRILLLCSVFVLFAVNVSAQKDQKDKPWTEWSQKEAMKVLADSAWAQTQTEFTETQAAGGSSTITKTQSRNEVDLKNAGKTESGETLGQKAAALKTLYHVGFLTSKPVRAAFVRLIELQKPESPADEVAARRAFVDRDLGDNIVVSLLVEGNDKNKTTPAKQALSAGTPETFKDVVYLERKDGKRLALKDYRAPVDAMGAKFIFPRMVDGQPFLDANSGEVRVNMEINKTKVIRKFKVAEMMYDGKLEY